MQNEPYRAKAVVKDDFDKLDNYDANRDMYYFHRRFIRLAKELPQDKDIRILDFGGGSGLFSSNLIKKGYKNIHLLDLSPTQVKQAKEKGLPNAHCGDENYLVQKFPRNSFDFVFMADVIEHLENPVDTLQKIRRVLKPRGKLLVTYPNPLWVPVLNVLGEIGLKLKGKDNKIYLKKIAKKLNGQLSLKTYEGHMMVSKLPSPLMRFFEEVETVVPKAIKRKCCILNIAVFEAA